MQYECKCLLNTVICEFSRHSCRNVAISWRMNVLILVSVGQMRDVLYHLKKLYLVMFWSRAFDKKMINLGWIVVFECLWCVQNYLRKTTLKCYSLRERCSVFSSVGVLLYNSVQNTSEQMMDGNRDDGSFCVVVLYLPSCLSRELKAH